MRRRDLLASAGLLGLAGCPDIVSDGRSPAETPGRSSAGDAQFEIRSPGVSTRRPPVDETVLAGEPVDVPVTVRNVGTAAGTATVTLAVDGNETDARELGLAADRGGEIAFEVSFDRAGEHTVSVIGRRVDAVRVTAPLEHDRLIGAHYAAWYGTRNWEDDWTADTPDAPLLGAYDSRDAAVINQHLKWCVEHGINWLSVNWYGENVVDTIIDEHVFEAELADRLHLNIVLDTNTREYDRDFDLGDRVKLRRLKRDGRYIAETYFGREPYLRRDGRPVLYIYDAWRFQGDVAGTFREIEDEIGEELYVIAELPPAGVPNTHPVYAVADAITTYNPYVPREDIEKVFHERTERAYDRWALGTSTGGVAFLPTVVPGYDDTEIEHVDRPDNPVLEPSSDRFERVCDLGRRYMGDMDAVFVTSFNEWFENTQVEPTEANGTAYLEVGADRLARAAVEPRRFDGTTVVLSFATAVGERELNPDANGRRRLSFYCRTLGFLEDGRELAGYDVGSEGEEPLFGNGVYGREAADNGTFRWFGGTPPETVFLVECDLESVSRLELDGWPAAATTVEVLVDGDTRGSTRLPETDATHVVEL